MVRFEVKEIGDGQVTVKAWRGKGVNPYAFYRFLTVERAERWMAEQKISDEARETRKQARMEAKKKARAEMVNPYQVGDVLYDSWGWEQTNIDWYQVVAVTERSVTLLAISGKSMETAFMSGQTVPVPGAFVTDAEPIKKALQVSVSYDGTIREPYIRSEHGWISKWDGQPKHYSSYA